MTKLRPLTEREYAVIGTYALENGRYWKARLRDDWMTARTTGILQALRNSHGESWLVSYSLPKRSQASENPPRTISVAAENGDIYEAIRLRNNEPWTISYPEGQDRFSGTEGGTAGHSRRLISKGPSAKIVG